MSGMTEQVRRLNKKLLRKAQKLEHAVAHELKASNVAQRDEAHLATLGNQGCAPCHPCSPATIPIKADNGGAQSK